jgi:hypothetical protein
MTDEAKSPWNSLEVTKLFLSLITPLAVVVIGLVINASFRTADDRRAREQQEAQLTVTRQSAVFGLSRFIYERRVRSELLNSALLRHGLSPTDDSKKEVIERKRDYDNAYVNWNINNQANLLLIRQILAAKSYSDFENVVESRLVGQTLAPLDACLTRAYDLAIRQNDPRPVLVGCQSKILIQRVLDCGYAITDELYRLSELSHQRDEADAVLAQRCPEQIQ